MQLASGGTHTFSFNLVIERLLISGRMSKAARTPTRASVSISLSSGFSFQDRIRDIADKIRVGFNLVIERLLISGAAAVQAYAVALARSFNLVIERLLISGFCARAVCPVRFPVSISLSSGFSFQDQSAMRQASRSVKVSISLSSGFSFQDNASAWHAPPYMFQSRYRAASHFRLNRYPVDRRHHKVSISLSSGFSFQATLCGPLANPLTCFNLVIERLLISGYLKITEYERRFDGFNLVIERLLISGRKSA